MAASGKVNASVEQANVSSGWDEARRDASTPPVTLEMKRKSSPSIHAPGSGAMNFHASFQTMERRFRDYLAQGKNECQKTAKAVARQMRSLKEEHPGYIITAAAVVGFACGLLLRIRRSRRRLNIYE